MDYAWISPQSINMKLDLHWSISLTIHSLVSDFLRLMWKKPRMQRFISPCQLPGRKWRKRRSKRGSLSTIPESFPWLKTASSSPHSPAPLNSLRMVPSGSSSLFLFFLFFFATPAVCHSEKMSALRNETALLMDSWACRRLTSPLKLIRVMCVANILLMCWCFLMLFWFN